MTNVPQDPRLALMLLSSVIEPGDADLDDLLCERGPVGTVEALWTGQATERLVRLASATVAATPNPAERAAVLQEATEACGAHVLIPGDPDCPPDSRSCAAAAMTAIRIFVHPAVCG